MARKKVERKVTEDPRYHNTWKLLKKYRDVVWSLELSVQQVRTQFQIEYDTSIEDFPESIYLAGAEAKQMALADWKKARGSGHQNNVKFVLVICCDFLKKVKDVRLDYAAVQYFATECGRLCAELCLILFQDVFPRIGHTVMCSVRPPNRRSFCLHLTLPVQLLVTVM